jgi:hypothetical protein
MANQVPKGWKQVSVNGDPKVYYESKIGNYVGTNGQSISIFARTDTAGNYQIYQTTPTSIFGGFGSPIYTFNQSGSQSGDRGLLKTDDFNKINTSTKQKSFEINQAVGTDGEKEALLGSDGYKSLAQGQDNSPENAPGANPNQDTSGSGSGAEPGTPALFQVTSKTFEKEQGEVYNNSYLKYPSDMNRDQDRIVITQSRYETPDVLTNGKIDTGKIIAGGFSKERTFTRNLGTVTLPMPNDISETNVTAWGEDSLSSLAALVGGAALGGVSSLAGGNVPSTIEEIKSVLGEVLGQGTPANEVAKQLLTLNAAAAVTQKLGININPEAFRSRITGTAINPNLELLFQGPKLRSFGFQFKMTPRSQDEAKNIRYILKFFKKGMASKRKSTNTDGAYFLGAPNVFDIHFRKGEFPEGDQPSSNELVSIGSIKTCALQQCVVNYTPDGFYAAFNDAIVGSQPISVTMQLAFTELTPIYNEYYDLTNEESVGFDRNTLTEFQ